MMCPLCHQTLSRWLALNDADRQWRADCRNPKCGDTCLVAGQGRTEAEACADFTRRVTPRKARR
jgi:hypothetical protein